MPSEVKEGLGVGTSDECVTGRIADGMFGYLINCLFLTFNPTVYIIQK